MERTDVLDGRDVGPVARKHLEGQRQALRRADQADANLFAIAALVAGITPLGLGIAFGLTFKISAGDIVEQKLEPHAEPLAVTLHQMSAQGVLVLAELVQRTIKPGIVNQTRVYSEQIVEGGRVVPMFRHAQLRGLRAKPRHRKQRGHLRPRHRFATGGQQLGQQFVQPQPVPQRQREVTLAKISRAFHPQIAQIGLGPGSR